jgi:hypothetical protein
MKRMLILPLILILLFTMLVSAAPVNAQSGNACWGQASKVFAQMGAMGEHSSSFETPRLGLRNLARALYEQGVLEADTMQALGAFVAAELGLEIDACR